MDDVQKWLGENNQLACDILRKKYLQDGESVEEFLERISAGDQTVKKLIRDKKFMFGGRIAANRGLQRQGKKITYSNCYVIEPPEDDLESIFETAKQMARTYSRGGGCGVDISKLSPKGAKINNAANETSGSVSFMDLFDLTTKLVGMKGRRGALMISIDCSHPDLEDFISVKNEADKITKANISVRISDEFMRAVKNDELFTLYFKRQETGEQITKIIKAKDMFMKLAEMNWRQAEPGILFWDRITKYNLMSENCRYQYAGVNPCGEEPLPAGGACLLGSLNLSEFVIHPFTDKSSFDFDDFESSIRIAVRALNDVLDEGMNLLPLKQQQDSVSRWRQIGLGIMGLHDMLIKLGCSYGDEYSLELCDRIGDTMAVQAIYESSRLTHRDGQFENCSDSKFWESEYFQYHFFHDTSADTIIYDGLRNSQLLTIAPTGSIANLFGVSSGIEPIFATTYRRKTESLNGKEQYYSVASPIIKEYMEFHHLTNEKDLPPWIKTAKEIDPERRIKMQSVWQQHIDASISSTINLPETASVEDIANIYIKAWEQGLKGVTIYRENCERAGILSTGNTEENAGKNKADNQSEILFNKTKPVTRSSLGRRLDAGIYIKEVACGKIYITISHTEEGDLVEVFVDGAKSGGCNTNTEAVGRLASMALRGGIAVDELVDSIKGLKCAACQNVKGSKVKKIDGLSCPDVIAKTIMEEYERQNNLDHNTASTISRLKKENDQSISHHNEDVNLCPECGSRLKHESGCVICENCAWSRCG